MDVRKLIDKLAKEEDDFYKRSFLAPMVKDGFVAVRIRGVVCRFAPESPDFTGWGIFHPVSYKHVKLLKKADRGMIRGYLDRLTPVQLIVCSDVGSSRTSILAHPAGSPVKTDGAVAVHLVTGCELFRHITGRFDGFNFWFDRVHPGHNPATAAFLRSSLDKDEAVERLKRPGLLPQEKKLYAELLNLKRIRREEPDRRRLRKALAHAGATLDAFQKRKGTYNVTFRLDGARHTSVIDTRDLTVLSAGICLSDEDEDFDLQSLVGVLREARQLDQWD